MVEGVGAHRRRLLRALPAVHRLLEAGDIPALRARHGHRPVKEASEALLTGLRDHLSTAPPEHLPAEPYPLDELAAQLAAEVNARRAPRLRRVINATGVVLHTNLGRALLSEAAREAILAVAGSFCNLELDLETGERGSRQSHVEGFLRHLTGAEAALVVNNNAAAVLLALSALAAGREVVVSRGELVEIGGSFRIPEVMAQGGARLVEVGTTNKTRAADYRQAITPDTALLLKVHPSNYRIVGFTAEVPLESLVAVGREAGLPVMYDLGSGALLPLEPFAAGGEPTAPAAIAAGADLVAMSGDKLLGGPQAGILLGRQMLIDRCRRHPLARAVRVDKFTLAALEATLRHYEDEAVARREVPTLRMLTASPGELADRARALCRLLRERVGESADINTSPGTSQAGGGSLPGLDLPTTLVTVAPRSFGAAALEERLRRGQPPVLARIAADRLLFDPRTLLPGEEEMVAAALVAALDPR